RLFREDDTFPAGRGSQVTTKAVYYGFKLALLCTMEGLPFRVGLVPADPDDREIAEWMLEHEVPGWQLADKGFSSQELVERLKERGQYLLIPPKRNSGCRWPRAFWRTFNRVRRRIETTASQLKGYFLLEFHRAKTFSGLAWRVLLRTVALILHRQYALGI
ncbi:MAG: transposase, partial [Anaerolineae bacterium]